MELIAFLFLISITLIVCYFLDVHKKITPILIKGWKGIKNIIEAPKGYKIPQNTHQWSIRNSYAPAPPTLDDLKPQLIALQKLFKRETIRAIYEGKEPPEMVGRGRYTRQSLLKEWNDEWESVARSMGIVLFEKVMIDGQFRWVDPTNKISELKFRTREIVS